MGKTLTVCVIIFFLFLSGNAFAASNDNTTINYQVQAINELNIDDATLTFTTSTATAGQDLPDTGGMTTYDITTNCATNAKKITGVLSAAMPSGLGLTVYMFGPAGASDPDFKALSNVAIDLVTGVDASAEQDIACHFLFNSSVTAGVVAAASRTLTITLADAS